MLGESVSRLGNGLETLDAVEVWFSLPLSVVLYIGHADNCYRALPVKIS